MSMPRSGGTAAVLPDAPLLGATPVPAATERATGPSIVARITFWFAAAWVVLVVLLALTVQWLPLHDYTVTVGPPNVAPHFGAEFLGTNNIGQSMLSRLCYGARVSIIIGIVSTSAGMLVGGTLGLLAAHFGGLIAGFVDLLSNSMLSIPPLLLLLAIVAALQASLPTLAIGLAIVTVPTFARVLRANALSQLAHGYVTAAKAMGATSSRIMFGEVLPNVVPVMLSYAVIIMGVLMIAEGSLSFLGLGIPPPTPSWGGMIADAQANMQFAPWPVFLPCAALFLTVYSLNALGDRLIARFDLGTGNL